MLALFFAVLATDPQNDRNFFVLGYLGGIPFFPDKTLFEWAVSRQMRKSATVALDMIT